VFLPWLFFFSHMHSLRGAYPINLQKSQYIAYFCKTLIGCHQSPKRGD
jgi:hypothetical protein